MDLDTPSALGTHYLFATISKLVPDDCFSDIVGSVQESVDILQILERKGIMAGGYLTEKF